ncbi:hypothetical protein D3C72_2518750 [compost metagenome]
MFPIPPPMRPMNKINPNPLRLPIRPHCGAIITVAMPTAENTMPELSEALFFAIPISSR